ncbi:hypothetical protein [Luteimicrobium sp. DT211]|uniref:hypothetical protein n=1 Tax=Luteimicrobium sp. DT211 TaxID=3393412 RepID=UPI003CF84E17
MVDPNAGAVPDDAREPGAPDGPDEPSGQDGSRPDESAWTDAWAEEQWRSLVADLEAASAGAPEASAPEAPAPDSPADDAPARTIDVAPWVRPTGPRDWPTGPEVEDLEEQESHYVPPEPPPVLGHDPLLNLAWGLVAAAPLVVLVVLVLVRPFPALVGQIAGAAFLAGIGVLLWRMPHRRDEDDDDPGAVV